MKAVSSVMRSRYLVCGLGIAAIYIVFAVLQANHFVNTLLRGEQYYVYYLAYVSGLYVILCLYWSSLKLFAHVGWSLAFGAVAGYAAGFIAYFAVVFSMGHGFSRIANSATDLQRFLTMLFAPFIYLSWAFGALTALVVYLVKKRAGTPSFNGNSITKKSTA